MPSAAKLHSSPPSGYPSGLRVTVPRTAANVVVLIFSLERCMSLTRAELDVARAAAASLSNEAIARRRGTSTRTVANQIASVFRKVHVSSRAGLASIAELSV